MSIAFLLTSLVIVATPGTGALAAAARRYVIYRPQVVRRVRRTFAASFVVLGVKLVSTPR